MMTVGKGPYVRPVNQHGLVWQDIAKGAIVALSVGAGTNNHLLTHPIGGQSCLYRNPSHLPVVLGP